MSDFQTDSDPFQRWLAEQVVASGISQREIARRCGISSSSLSEYLTGRRRPLPEACRKLANEFGVAEDVVLSLAGHRRAPLPEVADERESFYRLLRSQPSEVLDEVERWVRPFIRTYWETRQQERPAAPQPVELSIQLRWDEIVNRG